MAIKVKLAQLVGVVESGAFQRLLQLDGLPGKSVFDGHKLDRKAKQELDSYQAARNALIKKHGSGDPPAITPDSSGMAAFVKDMNELLISDVTLEVSKPVVPARIFDDPERPCGLRSMDLGLLDPFVVFEGLTDSAEKAKDGDAKTDAQEDAGS